MNVFDFMIWDKEQDLGRKSEEFVRVVLDKVDEALVPTYEDVAKEHLAANGRPLDDSLASEMARKLADALGNRTFEWERPRLEVVSFDDEKQMNELVASYYLHLHDVLERLGYGPYDSEQKSGHDVKVQTQR